MKTHIWRQVILWHLAICLSGFTKAVGQNAFWDALTIHSLVEREATIPEVKAALTGNIRINDFIDCPFSQEISSAEIEELLNKLSAAAIDLRQSTALAAPNATLSPAATVSQVVDATAKFLAERFREEATTLYINRFRKELEQVGQGALALLLPKTHEFLQSADVFDYKSLGSKYKEAFEEDLRNLMKNFRSFIKQPSPARNSLITVLPNSNALRAFVFGLDVAEQLIGGTHPIDVLAYLEEEYEGRNDYRDYHEVVSILNLIQSNLRDREDDTGSPFGPSARQDAWISFEELRLMDTPEELTYFTALLYHQNPDAFNSFLNRVGLTQVGKTAIPSPTDIQSLWNDRLLPYLNLLHKIDIILSEEQIQPIHYADLMGHFLELLKLANSDLGQIIPGSQSIEIAERIVDLYKSIHKKNYAYIVTNGIWLINEILRESGVNADVIPRIIAPLQQYGTLLVDIVTADNSDDVKEAIKRNVTSFSYLDKRKSVVSFTLMGVPSVAVGIEQLQSNSTKWNGNVGISAPIGFDWSWGNHRRISLVGTTEFNPEAAIKNDRVVIEKGASWGLFFGFADIGAAFNYRLSDSDSALPEEITLAQIFSPSFAIHHGFKNSPITAAAGIQYTPELRGISATNSDKQDNALKLLIRVSWDIPMIKLGAK